MKTPNSTQLLEFINNNRLEITPPEEESTCWIIYDDSHQLGSGVAIGKTFQEALEKAWKYYNN